MSNSAFTPTVLTIPGTGTSSSGQGELNLDTNPTASTDTTGYTAGTSHSVARSTTASPLDPLVTTCLDISSSAAVTDAASAGVYYSIASVPSSLRNKKLKLEFYVTTPASSAGTWGVSVRRSSGSTRVALTTDSGATPETILPSGFTGKFTTYFDTDSTTDYTIHFYQKARTSANTLKVTQVVVGPGIQPQGAVVGEWNVVSSPTIYATVTNPTKGTINTDVMYWRRIGSAMELRYQYRQTTAGTAGSGSYEFAIPNNLTIDSTASSGGGQSNVPVFGSAFAGDTAYLSGSVVKAGGANTATRLNLLFPAGGGSAGQSVLAGANTAYSLADANISYGFEATIPIAEWAGSGTVQLAQNDVEYASNDGSAGAAANTAYTTGMVYGPAGSNFVAVASTTTNASTDYLVRFQTPIQNTDLIQIEAQDATGTWNLISNYSASPIRTYQNQANSYYGLGWYRHPTVTTDIYVQFGNMGSGPNSTVSTAYAAAGNTWSGFTGRKWRVRKTSAGAAVGFGIVSSQSAGLLPATNANLDDATATRLGLKQYLHGTTYKDTIAPTVTLFSGGGTLTSVDLGKFIPYQLQDGTWRLKFTISVTLSSAVRTIEGVSVNGIIAPAYTQAISACPVNTIPAKGTFYLSTNNFFCEHSSVTNTGAQFSGDVELNAKPTWAY